MRGLVWFLAAFLVSSSGFAQPPGGQFGTASPAAPATPPSPPRDTSARKGTAILRGRILAADGGQPVRRAQVRLQPVLRAGSGGPQQPRVTSTDNDGRYEFKEVVAGRYLVTASKGSFIALTFGQRRPNEGGTPIEVLDGQVVEKVDFALPRGAVVTGRILDEFGDPTPDVQVAALRAQFVNGRRELIPTRGVMTNDIGEFRLFGLPPGQYYISATFRTVVTNTESDDHTGYAPTYYPGTPNVAEAGRVSLSVGQTLVDVSIVLTPTRTARVSGTAIDAGGKSLTGMILATQRTSSFSGMTNAAPIQPNGTFTLAGLPPGDYTLTLNLPTNGPNAVPLIATTDVTVNGADVDGVQLIALPPSTLTGRIVLAGTPTATPPKLDAMRLLATPRDPIIGFQPGLFPGSVRDDLTFEVKSAPGRRMLSLGGIVPGWVLSAVRLNGIDVTDSGFDVAANQEIAGLEVELTNRITTVSGAVKNAAGAAVTQYTAVIFPQDRDRWQRASSRYTRTARPSQDGRFLVSGLPAGDYYVVAVDGIEAGEATDPEFLDRASMRAARFSLADGDTRVLDLALTTNF